MSSSRNFSDQAIVIKRHNYAEADRIVTLFTLNHGKITAMAKGVRRITSRKAPHLEPFSHAKLYFAVTRGLPLITQAETISSFPHLRSALYSTSLAFQAMEVIDKIIPEQQAQPEAFYQLIVLLQSLDRSNLSAQSDQQQAVARFHLELLRGLGFGMPKNKDPDSLTGYIEQILDRRLTAGKHLS